MTNIIIQNIESKTAELKKEFKKVKEGNFNQTTKNIAYRNICTVSLTLQDIIRGVKDDKLFFELTEIFLAASSEQVYK